MGDRGPGGEVKLEPLREQVKYTNTTQSEEENVQTILCPAAGG